MTNLITISIHWQVYILDQMQCYYLSANKRKFLRGIFKLGLVKQMQMEIHAKGFDIDNNIIVCTKCFSNNAIKEFISNNDTGSDCTYCNKKGDASCSLEIVVEHIISSIRIEWGQPENEGLPYETREGGWIGEVYDSEDLFDIVNIGINSEELHNDILSSLIVDIWCKRSPYSLSKDRILFSGWKSFSKYVMNKVRYIFLNVIPPTYDQFQHDEMNPAKILEALTEITKELNLVEHSDKNKPIFRVRVVDDNVYLQSAKELGAPPQELAILPNRMSPAGIPMFYGAFDKQTAVHETYDPQISTNKKKKAICGEFYSTRDLVLLNLSRKSEVPDLFDEKLNNKRSIIKFLIDFIDDFSKPIARDNRSHIEYVPTQVVTEYFRHMFRSNQGERLDGIIFPSSKNNGHSSVVIFADNSSCADRAPEYKKDILLFLERTEELSLNS